MLLGKLGKKKKRLREAEASALRGDNIDEMVKLKSELVGLIAKEKQMW